MANNPRVEITDKALSVLKLETALGCMGQKQTLEALILRGASSRVLALLEEKPNIDVVEEVPVKPIVDCSPSEGDISEKEKIRSALVYIRDELAAGRYVSLDYIVKTLGVKRGDITRRSIQAYPLRIGVPDGIRTKEAREKGYQKGVEYITDLSHVEAALKRMTKTTVG